MAENSVKFTKGPWKYNPKTSQVYAASQICKIWQFGDGEGKANAHLIAAAPELYEALELADAALSGANMNMNVVERKVKAALAKARGEL
jgi:hypothetical protein